MGLMLIDAGNADEWWFDVSKLLQVDVSAARPSARRHRPLRARARPSQHRREAKSTTAR
jgi:hypothetical protein